MKLYLSVLTFVFSIFASLVAAQQTHTFDWTLSSITATPDGVQERPVVAVNGEFPLPVIRIRRGDKVIINLTNNLSESTSLHFHGIFMNGTSYMDGAAMISQCPIPPGQQFTYEFVVDQQEGTYWYHSHSAAQYGDGLRGAFIVEGHDVPEYDEDRVIMLSDWYHTPTSILVDTMNKPNRGGEPRIDSALFNETHDLDIFVEPGKTYYLRLINMGMSASQFFYIEDHELTIVEIDGVKVEPMTVDSVKLATGQRYGVLLKTKEDKNTNFAIVQITNIMMHKKYDINWLVYNSEIPPRDKSSVQKIKTNQLKYPDDILLRPKGSIQKLPVPNHEIAFTFESQYLGDNRQMFYTVNGQPHISPKVPTMNTLFSANHENVLDTLIYGDKTNALILEKGDIVQITVNSNDHMRHPFHLHGHTFQVLAKQKGLHFIYEQAKHELIFPDYPMIRDTIDVPSNGHVVLRFVADNPGVWFFHCHTEWHAVQGLGVVFLEAPDEVLKNGVLPQEFYDICEAGGIPAKGDFEGKDLGPLDPKPQATSAEKDVETTLATSTIEQPMSSPNQETTETPISTDLDKTNNSKESSTHEVGLKTKTFVLIAYFSIMTAIVGIAVFCIGKCKTTKTKRRLMSEYE